MNAQLSIFDLQAGQHARDEGIARILARNEDFITTARAIAELLYLRQRSPISSDDVRNVLDQLGIYPSHPNAFGGIFKNGKWECVGWIASEIKSNHARPIRSWRLKQNT